MPTNFPTSVDNFTNPTANDSLNLPSHSTQHANANDAIEAVESYLLTEPMGLRLIKKQTIGSAVSTVSVTSVFSSTYESYLIIINGDSASLSANLQFQLSAATGSTYSQNYEFYAYGSSSSSISASSGTSSFVVQFDGSNPYNSTIQVNGPNVARATLGQVEGNAITYNGQGRFKETSSGQSTGFTVFPSGGTITGGTIYVYGYAK